MTEPSRIAHFVNSEYLSDVSIKITPEIYKAHKIILAAGSLYFRDLFSRDKSVTALELPALIEPFSLVMTYKEVFPTVLTFLYTDQDPSVLTEKTLTPESAWPLLSLSHGLKISSLTTHVVRYLTEKALKAENAADFLMEGLKFEIPEMVEKSKSLLVTSIEEAQHSELLLKLPFEEFLQLINQDALAATSESTIYNLVTKYIEKNEVEEIKKVELFKGIRWSFLKHEELLEASTSPMYSSAKNLIIEGLSAQISSLESHSYEINRAPRNYHKKNLSFENVHYGQSLFSKSIPVMDSSMTVLRKSYPTQSPKPPQSFSPDIALSASYRHRPLPIDFEYTHDLDENGALFHLGTYGRTEEWRNPHTIGQVEVICSSLGFGKLEDFVGRTATNLRTGNEPYSYFGVDLSPGRLFIASAYTLRNRNSTSQVCFNWQFEGSINRKDWVVLDRRIHMSEDIQQDLSEERRLLKQAGAVSTWGIAPELSKVDTESPNAYRFFRVVQIDKNSSGSHCLAVSGLELYGVATAGRWA